MLGSVAEKARDYARDALAPSTRRAYRSDWGHFEAWCAENGVVAMPAAGEAVALYLSAHAECLKPATLTRRLATLSQAHKARGHPSPTGLAEVRAVMAGIRRAKGTAPTQKAPLRTADIRAMVARLPESLLGARDRALLLLGFAGGFRRSELVGLDVADLEKAAHGVTVTLRRSKTDQAGETRKVGVPRGHHPETCPVGAVDSWLDAATFTDGPVFRYVDRHGNVGARRLGDRTVARVVKRTVEATGLDPSRFAGHSLRAGLATSAAEAGASERSIMEQTGHRSTLMVRRYIREGSLYADNAASKLGL